MLNRKLHVHQAHYIQGFGHGSSLALDFGNRLDAQ